MNTETGISVVIPAFNYGHCLARAVRSVATQEYARFQLLVIDDGSTDDTAAVVEAMYGDGIEFEYQYQDNAGLSAVRNRGIREARYDWLLFLDADDELLPGALQRLASVIDANPRAALVLAGHVNVLPDGSEREVRPPVMSDDGIRNLSMYLFKQVSIASSYCALHRGIFSAIEYRSDLRQTEDLPVFAHALAHYPVAVVTEPITRMYKHADSMRHDAQAASALGMRLENVIFDESDLPDRAQGLRRDYRARRAFSLLKLCYGAGDYDRAVHYFGVALHARPLQALAPRYLRRYLVSLWKR